MIKLWPAHHGASELGAAHRKRPAERASECSDKAGEHYLTATTICIENTNMKYLYRENHILFAKIRNYQITKLPNYQITNSPNYRNYQIPKIAKLPNYKTVNLPNLLNLLNYQITKWPHHRNTKLPNYQKFQSTRLPNYQIASLTATTPN